MAKKNVSPVEETSDRAVRRPWTAPSLTVIRAGSAELAVGQTDDGVDKS